MALYAQRLVATKMTQSIADESELAPMFYVLKIMVLHLSAEYFRSKLKDVDEVQEHERGQSAGRSDSPLASADTRCWIPPKSCVNSFTRHVAKLASAQSSGAGSPLTRFIGDSEEEEEEANEKEEAHAPEQDTGAGGLEVRVDEVAEESRNEPRTLMSQVVLDSGIDLNESPLMARRRERLNAKKMKLEAAAREEEKRIGEEQEEGVVESDEERDSERDGGRLGARGHDDLKGLMKQCKAILAQMREERARDLEERAKAASQMQEMMARQQEIMTLMLDYTARSGGMGGQKVDREVSLSPPIISSMKDPMGSLCKERRVQEVNAEEEEVSTAGVFLLPKNHAGSHSVETPQGGND